MITNEQRDRRKKGIFASDVARIMMGDSVTLAMEKLGQREPDDLDDVIEVQLGHIIEPKILDAYEVERPVLAMERSPDTMFHPVHRWLGAHLDGVAVQLEERINTECKSVGWYRRQDWGEGGDEVPHRVLWQVQAQMAVSGIKTTHIPVCFINEESLKYLLTGKLPPIRIFVVPADEELEQFIVEKAGYVWSCIQGETLPTAERLKDVQLIYPKDNGLVVEADEFIFKTHTKLMDAKDRKKQAEKDEDEQELIIKAFMEDASEVRFRGQKLATWKKDRDTEKLDQDSLKSAKPEICAQFMVPKIGSRKFLPKKIKE